jgi:hypothetical protein
LVPLVRQDGDDASVRVSAEWRDERLGGQYRKTEAREMNPEKIRKMGEALAARHRGETESLKQSIGESLMSLRTAAGFSREGIAALIGTGRGTILVAEMPASCKRALSYEKLAEIRAAYEACVGATKGLRQLKKGRAT